jgi:PAS domain S-box-containing protein
MARNEAGKPSGYLVRWRKLAFNPEASKQLTDLLGSQVALYYGNNQGDLWTDLLKVLPPPPIDLRSTPNVTHYTRDGNPVMALARPINGTPWFVVVEFREQDFLNQSTAFLRVLGLISLVLFAFGVAAAFALSRNITRPLHSLTEAASAISGGDHSRLVGIRQNDELGKLAEAFDAMVIKLRDSQRELERQVQEKTLLLEAAPSAMLGVDERGRIVLANNQTERLFGYTQDELSERPIEMLIPERFRVTHADHRAGFFQQPSSRPMGAGRDLYGVRKDGSEFPVEIGLNPLATERGMMVLSAIVDITERKRAEEKLREQAAMLNQAQEAILVREMDGSIRFWNQGA